MGETVVGSSNGAEHTNSSSTDSSTLANPDDQPPLAEPPDALQDDQEKLALFHTRSAQHAADQLETDLDHGLTDEEAAARLVRDGLNTFKGARGLTLWQIFLQQIANALTAVLVAVAVLSFIISDYIEGSVVLAVIVLNIVVG